MAGQQARARDRQHRILTAAAEVFARRGYGESAVDDIAKAAGTSKGGVYFHFPGKEAIVLALLDQTAALLMRKVHEAIDAERDPVAKAEAALHVLLRTLTRHRTLARVFAVEALGAGPRVNRRIAELHGQFAQVIEEQLNLAIAEGAIQPVDTQIVAQAWVGILNAVVTRWLLTRKEVRLEEIYPTVRLLLLRSVGIDEPIAAAPR